MKARTIVFLVLGLLILATAAGAAPLATFENTIETDQVFLFLDQGGDVSFQGWVRQPWSWVNNPIIGDPWNTDISQDHLLSASGEAFGTYWFNHGYFTVNVNDNQTDFAMEYAYLMDGMIVDAGTGLWNAGTASWTWNDNFTSTVPNPIGGTVWLMASGLLAFAAIRRRKGMLPQ
jgi:hypothetical protein